ncbi:hypothetical protein GCM10023216_23810 [Isoptericola chiayiensis]|uniref:DnaJ homologue subfamily C member 28 conserved domain-containing protein n=1 Tax=Isoptericola chiayiensis TaxID=579446 RepID=A0ABP8YIH8_9MICO|nr:hypothetical protein [Isoptericola chiayiensis]
MEGHDDPVRRAAQYRMDRESEREAAEAGRTGPAGDRAPGGPPSDEDETRRDAEQRRRDRVRRSMTDRARWVDTLVDQAMRRGDFDDLPSAGKPLRGIGGTHDPDWWLKNLVEREQVTGVLPPAQLRQESAAMDETLDRESDEAGVRRVVEDFNARVVDARRQLTGGPPVVTPTRDVDAEVRRWRERRRAQGIYE